MPEHVTTTTSTLPTDEHVKKAVSSSIRESAPKSRIATIQVCWIEDNARSLNNRIYPSETVDRLIISGQRKLADSNALPITCFLSHADADNDHTPALIGRATRIWREGTKGMAQIDLADTSHARDALGLIVGNYIRTESLRASNAELKTDKRYDVPVVGGDRIELDGIDLTNYPGLEACARIQQVQIAESAKHTPLIEVFDLSATAIHQLKEGQDMPTPQSEESSKINEEYVTSPRLTGDSPSMDGSTTQDAYAQAMYKAPDMTSGPMQGMTTVSPGIDVVEAHDRIAMVQNRACAPGRESSRWQAIMATLSESDRIVVEAGKQLSSKNDAHLDAAHHATARHLGLTCEGKNNKVSTPTLPDPDDEMGGTESKKVTRPMSTKEDALQLLESLGYEVQAQPRKSEADVLREQLEAMKAENAKSVEEMKALFTATQKVTEATTSEAPQRKSMVSGANVDSGHKGSIKGSLYQHGKYLKEQISNADWDSLADRTCPLPENVDLGHLIKEFEQLYAVQYDNRFQVLSATELD